MSASTSTWTPPAGRIGNLTPEQEKALEEFRTQIKADGLYVEGGRHDDATLLRFLRARKFDVKLAKEMFAACEKWRTEFGTNDLIKDGFAFPEHEQVSEIYPQFYHKTDKEGRPIWIERLGKVDFTALNKITTEDRLLRHLVYEYEKFLHERLPACSAAVGHPVETSCSILDLKGVGLGQFFQVKAYVGKVANIGQNYYPETMGKFYIINAPFLFSTVWNVVKGWLDPVTAAKIDILGSSYKDKLLQNIVPENLPTDLSGTCTCSPSCSLSDAGPWNPAHQ
ncbi:CRAL-TRIO domain-containing protein [Auriculariales sp. MPI-PUGE-AT-0066]|nr:CRAL-TRIO domain-containing protein [Auriculariales sp. MPI-PUGE-AT-0066]